MTDRAKLMILIDNLPPHEGKTFAEALADHLIANGVTVQRWIPFAERRPTKADANSEGKILVWWSFGAVEHWYIHDISKGDVVGMTHWMPCPEPPGK